MTVSRTATRFTTRPTSQFPASKILPSSDDELVTHMNERRGHNLFHLSEFAAIVSLPSSTGKRDAGESFEAAMEEVVKRACTATPLRRRYRMAR
ncbi:hypothetical protein [Paraburkholderia sp. BL6665CI2N2]|uniref:hypothetical protein n=1 Tax=Paraburkholderia sp. BL6665CI2N2 TaxID=1938806 RepID=UPI001416EE72|nr:hypothetical protein [Paraburkholderia sp. BL6665CI2N2]